MKNNSVFLFLGGKNIQFLNVAKPAVVDTMFGCIKFEKVREDFTARCVCLCSGGGVYPVLSQTHECHRGHAVQHELHQQQPGDTDHWSLQPQWGRWHKGQKRQIQKVITWLCLYTRFGISEQSEIVKRANICFFFVCFKQIVSEENWASVWSWTPE